MKVEKTDMFPSNDYHYGYWCSTLSWLYLYDIVRNTIEMLTGRWINAGTCLENIDDIYKHLKQDNLQTSKQDNQQTSKQDNLQTSKQDNLQTCKQDNAL